jgi:hypothetical protein
MPEVSIYSAPQVKCSLAQTSLLELKPCLTKGLEPGKGPIHEAILPTPNMPTSCVGDPWGGPTGQMPPGATKEAASSV